MHTKYWFLTPNYFSTTPNSDFLILRLNSSLMRRVFGVSFVFFGVFYWVFFVFCRQVGSDEVLNVNGRSWKHVISKKRWWHGWKFTERRAGIWSWYLLIIVGEPRNWIIYDYCLDPGKAYVVWRFKKHRCNRELVKTSVFCDSWTQHWFNSTASTTWTRWAIHAWCVFYFSFLSLTSAFGPHGEGGKTAEALLNVLFHFSSKVCLSFDPEAIADGARSMEEIIDPLCQPLEPRRKRGRKAKVGSTLERI